ncbi:putative f-box domain protein [Diplodia seriata]|uniref:Putative f-box domain protein n=1 Tax=Diplodia seriata TaxID=420778 RepID=A0A0G2H782_9PEZI|nr:putative f-box domain protein [Diplodia seriata]
MSELVPTWLTPCSATLTTLSLHSDQYFGYLPLLDLRPLHLPRLRTLALGNYTISHSWQISWLTAHCPRLRHLHLDDCSIIPYFQLLATPDAATGYIPPPHDPSVLHPDAPVIRTSPLRWSHLFAHLLTHAPHLRTFRIGSSGLGGWHHRHVLPSATQPADNDNDNNDDDSDNDNNNADANDPSHPRIYANLRTALHPDRYLICHMGIGPSWYTDLGTLAWPALFEPEDGAGSPAGDETERFIDALEAGVVDAEDKAA